TLAPRAHSRSVCYPKPGQTEPRRHVVEKKASTRFAPRRCGTEATCHMTCHMNRSSIHAPLPHPLEHAARIEGRRAQRGVGQHVHVELPERDGGHGLVEVHVDRLHVLLHGAELAMLPGGAEQGLQLDVAVVAEIVAAAGLRGVLLAVEE